VAAILVYVLVALTTFISESTGFIYLSIESFVGVFERIFFYLLEIGRIFEVTTILLVEDLLDGWLVGFLFPNLGKSFITSLKIFDP